MTREDSSKAPQAGEGPSDPHMQRLTDQNSKVDALADGAIRTLWNKVGENQKKRAEAEQGHYPPKSWWQAWADRLRRR
jgi:hypothetical protein